MGYYTDYKLNVLQKHPNGHDWATATLLSHSKYNELGNAFAKITGEDEKWFWRLINGDADDCKWYEHDEHMAALSQEFPDFLFLLEGRGEEQGDVWKTYYRNRKIAHYKAELVFPEVNLKRDLK